MKKPTYEEILGAVARGWCSRKNQHKEVDTDLAIAVSNEVSKLVGVKIPADVKRKVT